MVQCSSRRFPKSARVRLSELRNKNLTSVPSKTPGGAGFGIRLPSKASMCKLRGWLPCARVSRVVSRLPGSTGTETCTEYGERLFRKLVFDFRQTKLPISRTIAMRAGAADVDQFSARSARVTTNRLGFSPIHPHSHMSYHKITPTGNEARR